MTNQSQRLFCQADLNYVDQSFAEPVIVNVAIRDGRQTFAGSWQDCGFELLPHKSQVQHWQEQEIMEIHYAEIAVLARQLTGCDHALVGSHIIRNPQQASLHPDLAPIRSVHSDFAASYGDLIRSRYLMDDAQTLSSLRQAGISGEDVGRARRLLIFNFGGTWVPRKWIYPWHFAMRERSRRQTLGRHWSKTMPVAVLTLKLWGSPRRGSKTSINGMAFRICIAMRWWPFVPMTATASVPTNPTGRHTQPLLTPRSTSVSQGAHPSSCGRPACLCRRVSICSLCGL